MTDVLITEFFDPKGVADLARDFDVLYDPDLGDDRTRLMTLVEDTFGLVVRNKTLVDRELLESAPHLRVVARMGVGLDNIDTNVCDELGIRVTTGAGLNATAVAEYVVTSILWLTRGLGGATKRVVAGEWPRQDYIGLETSGRRLGLLGFGEIARAVSNRALSLGMTVVAHDPYIPEDDSWGSVSSATFASLLETSDVVSVHVPKTPETIGLLGADQLSQMQHGAILINTSRGGIVDESAVAEAVRRGRLRGAALDVFEREPVTADSGRSFDAIPNLLLSPHVAGITAESEKRIATALVVAIGEVLGSSR